METRRLQVTTVAGLDLPHATQALRITRRVRPLASRRWRTVRVDAVTNLTAAQASRAAGRLDPGPLEHRGVAPHPRHHLRRGRLPDPHRHRTRAMASLRNLAIGILRLHGWRKIAATLRRNARDATRVLPLLGITTP